MSIRSSRAKGRHRRIRVSVSRKEIGGSHPNFGGQGRQSKEDEGGGLWGSTLDPWTRSLTRCHNCPAPVTPRTPSPPLPSLPALFWLGTLSGTQPRLARSFPIRLRRRSLSAAALRCAKGRALRAPTAPARPPPHLSRSRASSLGVESAGEVGVRSRRLNGLELP